MIDTPIGLVDFAVSFFKEADYSNAEFHRTLSNFHSNGRSIELLKSLTQSLNQLVAIDGFEDESR